VSRLAKYKVLVVDDSVFMRKIISDMIGEDDRFQVVDTARNGREAVQKAKQHAPDVITLDIEMPEMNGLEALRLIMADNPTPVIMLSSLTEEGAKETIAALELGAVDFVRKPSGSISLDLFKVQEMLMEKLVVAVSSRVQPIVKRKPQVASMPAPELKKSEKSVAPINPSAVTDSKIKISENVEQLVAIGTSTGGPRALHQVLTPLPKQFPAPIVIVQHMPPNFTRSLAQRLNVNSQIRVVEATHGMILENGTAYIAPGGWHMGIERNESGGYRVKLSMEEPRGGHRPCVDTLFETIIPLHELKRHIVLLTGMGSDGAQGMLSLRHAGAVQTIAESSETCVVYGMPRAAAELGGAMLELPLYDIASKLVHTVSRFQEWHESQQKRE
jgi:two-component system, chemotaxis family, protein-glutamate methylesterase/glutaminase